MNTNNEIKAHVLSIIDTLENPPRLNSDQLEERGERPNEKVIISGLDYLSDVLDVEWILNADKTLKGARLLVAFGGPNIYISTATSTVEGHWWNDSYSASYTDNMGLEEAVQELFDC